MKKTVYIHIGSPKTGTSSIQGFLTKNHDLLLKQGLFYPLFGRKVLDNRSNSLPKKSFFDSGFHLEYFIDFDQVESVNFANGNVLTNASYSYSKKNLEKITKKFAKYKASSMILSEEILFHQLGRNFSEHPSLSLLASKFEVKIIVYLKKSVEYLATLWQESIKDHSDISLELYLEEFPYLLHLKVIDDLATKVGKENIIIRCFEKEDWLNGNLIHDFLSIFNIKCFSQFNYLKRKINASFTRERLEKFRYINRYLDIMIAINEEDIYRKLPEVEHGHKIIDSLSDEIIKKVSDKYYPYECMIAQKFLGRDQLFAEKYPEIYGTKREVYLNKFSEETKRDLQFVISIIAHKQSVKKASSLKYIFIKPPVLFLCCFVPSKKLRFKFRSYLLSKIS